MTKEIVALYLENGFKGRRNVISSRELERVLGISGNELRRRVNRLRQDTVPIAADQRGYYFAETAAEVYGHEDVRRDGMGETNITINFDAAKLDALEFTLRKQRSSVQRRMAEMLQQLYESEVPEAVREYVDSKTAPAARPKRPVRAAKAANGQAAAMQQEE